MMRRCLILIAVVAALAGCAHIHPIQDPDLRKARSLQEEKKFREAADLYDKMAAQSRGSARGEEALFAAARVRCEHDNPQKDYQRALQGFEDFLRTYPDSEWAGDAQDWRSLIRTILDLKKEILELMKENERLSKSIEELKRVDIRHEERRRH